MRSTRFSLSHPLPASCFFICFSLSLELLFFPPFYFIARHNTSFLPLHPIPLTYDLQYDIYISFSGHMFVYPLMWEFIAKTTEEKKRVSELMSNVLNYIIKNDLVLIDVDGKPTYWGVWNPTQVCEYICYPCLSIWWKENSRLSFTSQML